MLKMKTRCLAIVIAGLLFFMAGTSAAYAGDNSLQLPDVLKGLKISGLGYLNYSNGVKALPGNKDQSYNDFSLNRGYLTVEKKITPWLSARSTTDIYRDSTGHYSVYEKYLYADLKPGNLSVFTQMNVEIGQGHTPWIDFAEHINPYRCLNNTALDRTSAVPSADLGISIHGNFDGKLADAKERVGTTGYDGNYGSWHIGVYNGAGYHTGEKNNNKVVEGRLTVRPLPAIVPGLQLSYFGAYGKGNVASPVDGSNDLPDFNINLGMLSYQNPMVILTAQYFQTRGNASGTWVNPATGKSLTTEGYSFFGNLNLGTLAPRLSRLSVFARYDYFDGDKNHRLAANDHATYKMVMAGLAYKVYKGNLLALDYENIDYGADSGGQGAAPVIGNNLGHDHKVQVVWQVAF